MADTRQAILEELLARLQTIRRDDGYQTDAGATVFLYETPQLGPDDPNEAIALIPRDDVPSDQGGEVLTVLPIDIQALAKADTDETGTTVEAVRADIRQAIESGDRTLGGLLTRELVRGRTRTVPRDAGVTTVRVGTEYSATYLDAWGVDS
jgi:hypothetical protein